MSMKNRSKHGVNTVKTHLSHSVTSSVPAPQQTQSVTTVSVNSQQLAFNVDGAFKTLEKIRRNVTIHHEKYFLRGRKEMLDLMSQVYQQFKSAKDSDEFDAFMGRIRDDLNKATISYSPSSTASSQLITYLFAGLTYKQTHVYSRALDEAYRQGIASSGFKSFVDDKKGFEGVRQSITAAAGNNTTTYPKKLLEAFTEIDNYPTVETIDLEWGEEEKYRIYVAVLNEDGGIDLKDSKLNKKYIDETILRIKSFSDQLKKPSKSKSTKIKSSALIALQALLATENANKEHLDRQLEIAIAKHNDEDCESFRAAIYSSEAVIMGIQFAIDKTQKSLK